MPGATERPSTSESKVNPASRPKAARFISTEVSGGTVTTSYPDQEPTLAAPLIYRGVHRLNKDHEGRVKCVACFLCATACPAHCIDIIAAESPWPDREKYPESFAIDELRCIYCGMCEEACPVDAIELTSLYNLTGRSREEMIFDKEKLLSVFDATLSGQHEIVFRRRSQHLEVGGAPLGAHQCQPRS